jgi:hypothetical protein
VIQTPQQLVSGPTGWSESFRNVRVLNRSGLGQKVLKHEPLSFVRNRASEGDIHGIEMVPRFGL